MLPTFRQQFPPGVLTPVAQHVQLLIESCGATAHTRFPEFRQPLGSIPGVIDVSSGTGNRPTAVHGFQSIMTRDRSLTMVR